MTNQEKPYFEGFFVVVFVEPAILTLPIDQPMYRACEWKMAEVNIPLETDEVLYCMIAMLPQVDVSTPAIFEMTALQTIMPDVVENYKEHFKEVSRA